MAVLTDDDFTAYKRGLRNDPAAKAEMRSLSPSKGDWKATLQALEDGYETRRAAIKAEMDTAMGATLTNALSKKLEKVWMHNKAKGL